MIPDAPDIRRAERTGYGHDVTPEPVPVCAKCGAGLAIYQIGALCPRCEAEAERKLRQFLRGLAPEELEFIDCTVEGLSLVDIAKEDLKCR